VRQCKLFLMAFLLGLMSIFFFQPQVTATTNYQEKIFEFRGAWVATVSNMDMPRQASTQANDIKAYQDEFLQILDVFEAYRLNAVIFQVRPTNDAFYSSTINPWSRFLINVEGQYPGWDPMAWMIERCHERNMEFHAWLNPYRASLGVLPDTGDYQSELNSYLQTLSPLNFARKHPDLLVRGIHAPGDARILLNPAEPLVRKHIYDTIEEIVRKYNVDAIHFDDYFYNGVADAEDNANYQAYLKNNPYLSKGDWRREQVNILIKGIHDLLENLNSSLNKQVQFGISPAGVWAPADNMGCGAYGQPGGMTDIACYSYSSYVDLFADTKKWVNEGWIDYLVPQNYGNLNGNHPAITRWWANEVSKGDVKLYIGLAPYQYINSGWSIPEMDNQMMLGYSYPSVSGYVFFSIRILRHPTNNNLTKALEKLQERWSHGALPPLVFPKAVSDYSKPTLSAWRNANHINLSFDANPNAYGYLLYRLMKDEVFNAQTTPIFDVVANPKKAFTVRHQADNLTDYTYYVQTVFNDGTMSTDYQVLSTGIYDNNAAPVLNKVRIEADSLVFAYRDWIKITGEVSDINNDEVTLTIALDVSLPNYSLVFKTEIVDGKFSFLVFIPPQTINRGRFVITASDGLDSTVVQTIPFYSPASKYTDLMISFMNMELMLSDFSERIYGD